MKNRTSIHKIQRHSKRQQEEVISENRRALQISFLLGALTPIILSWEGKFSFELMGGMALIGRAAQKHGGQGRCHPSSLLRALTSSEGSCPSLPFSFCLCSQK